MYVLSGLDTTIEAQDLRAKTSSTAVSNALNSTEKSQSLQAQNSQRLRIPHRGYIQFIDVNQLNATILSSPITQRAHSPFDAPSPSPSPSSTPAVSPLSSSMPPPSQFAGGPKKRDSNDKDKEKDKEKGVLSQDAKKTSSSKINTNPNLNPNPNSSSNPNPSSSKNQKSPAVHNFKPKYIGLDTKFRWTVVEDKQNATIFTIVPAQIDSIEATLGKSICNMFAGHFEYDLLLSADSRIHLHAGPTQVIGTKVKGRNLWKNLQGHAANNSERHGYWEQFKVAPLVMPSSAFKGAEAESHNTAYNEVSNCMNIQ